MKKKLLLITLLVALFACIFVVSVSAEDTIPEWPSEVTILEGMSDKATFGADGTEGATSRVLMSDGKAYPAYYILSDSETITLSFTEIKSKGYSYTKDSIVRIEFPTGITTTGTAFRASDGCKNVVTIVLPEGLTEIGADSFRGKAEVANTKLVSITLPSTLEVIEKKRFNIVQL